MSYTDKMQDAAQNFAKSVNPDFVIALGGGGGSELPDYSGANDGDVLAIASGAPAWTTPSAGGAGVFVVTITTTTQPDPENPDNWWLVIHCDKTPQEVETAYNNGLIIVADLGNNLNVPLDDNPTEEISMPHYLIMNRWAPPEETPYEYGYPSFYYQSIYSDEMKLYEVGFELTGGDMGFWSNAYPLTSEG